MTEKIISKKDLIKKGYNDREIDLIFYCIDLYKSDIQCIESCNKEINIYENTDVKFYNAIKKHTENMFRLEYQIAVLNLFLHYNFEIKILTLKLIK